MEPLLRVFFAPIQFFMSWPLAALVPGLVFVAAYAAYLGKTRGQPRQRESLWLLIAGLAWVGFAFYELRAQAWSRTVTVGRGDLEASLVMIAPLLYALALLAAWAAWRVLRTPRADRRTPPRG